MIRSFTDEYRFLSNFYSVPINVLFDYAEPSGWLTVRSVEHGFQALKATAWEDFRRVGESLSAAEAKRRGRRIKCRPDWEAVRDVVMLSLLRQKFGSDVDLINKLKTTAPHDLVEGNTWGDQYWGVCNGVGVNCLGQLLMQVRQELIDGKL